MLAALFLLNAVNPSSQTVRSTVTLQILRPSVVTPETWHEASQTQKSEIIRRDETGTAIEILRLSEHQ